MQADHASNSVIQRDCARPIYVQVAEYLTSNIDSGRWIESDRIPSEAELTETLQVSRGSVKKAISMLVDNGVLEQIQGKGTYVKEHDISFPLTEGLISFSESLMKQGIEFETEIVSIEENTANEEIARQLSIPIGAALFRIERVRRVKGEPIMYIENNINSSLAPGISEADFVNDSIFSIIERLTNHKVSYSKTSFVATSVDAQRARYLEVEEKTPILQQVQTVFLDNDQAIEYANVWLKSNRFHLGTVFQRHQQ